LPRGADGNFADAVGFSEGVVILAADDLETPKTEDQHSHDGGDEVLDEGESNSGHLFFAVEHGRGNSEARG